MPRMGVTIYEVLLSCPGDVIDLKDTVKECLDDFNRTHGNINNVNLELKHWSTDAYPQSGGSAQELLNNQFIHECDACIALLGNRFGSPTNRYDSGTEEEIEDMIESGKQVFMYFIERPTDPSNIDIDQLSKVREFKDKYSENSKGIYWIIKNKDELKKELSNHLGLYFLQLIVKPERVIENKILPELKLKFEEDIKSKYNMKLSSCNFMQDKEGEIKKNIELIQNIVLEEKEKEVIDNKTDINFLIMKTINIEYTKFQFNENDKKIINEYCNDKKIALQEEFWNLGNLKVRKMPIVSLNGYKPNIEGESKELEKYELIEKLLKKISEYNCYIKFFSNIDSYSYLTGYIENSGKTFDEDIDVKIKIPKDCIVKASEIPIPEGDCIEEINEIDITEVIFLPQKNHNIEEYNNYPIIPYIPELPSINLYGRLPLDIYQKEKDKYLRKKDRIFCYEYYDDKENDILKFNIEYLKQKNSMYLPSILFFKKRPEYIEYEITSKHFPDIVSDRYEMK